MTTKRRIAGWIPTAIAGCATALLACGAASTTQPDSGGGSAGSGGGQAMTDGGAGGGTGVAMYPTWQLQDIQPASPRFNQTYGLAAFAGRPVVAMLLEGF